MREEAFCDTGEVYVKRRADGPPSVAAGPGRVVVVVVVVVVKPQNPVVARLISELW